MLKKEDEHKEEICQDPDCTVCGFYCNSCGGCGYIGCCGVRSFLEKCVAGKTGCKNEETFIKEIIDIVEDSELYKINN